MFVMSMPVAGVIENEKESLYDFETEPLISSPLRLRTVMLSFCAGNEIVKSFFLLLS